jgi:hypothetical protein
VEVPPARLTVPAIGWISFDRQVRYGCGAALSGGLNQLARPVGCFDILMRQKKCQDNIVEQNQRGAIRVSQPMVGLKSFWSEEIIIAGIEATDIIRKGQVD